jgi:hypothetical protein
MALQSVAFACGVLPAWAQAGPPSSEPRRPALQIGSAGRFDEDWSVLRGVDLSKTDDFWDRLKFIPLTRDGSVWLSIGGQARERGEYFRHYLFGSSEPEETDAYLLSRYRLSADLHVTPYFRMFAEGKSSLALDRDLEGGRTTAYVDELDLFNGFADVMIPLGDQASVTLRGGRQELIFGSQRLVGPGDFTQVPHTFEGGAGFLRIFDWVITGFWAQPVVVDKYRFDKSTPDQELFGAFATGPLHLLPVNLDLYWLDASNRIAAFNGTTGRERRHTLGGRLWGKIAATGLDFEVEGAAQFGTLGRADIAASFLGYIDYIGRQNPCCGRAPGPPPAMSARRSICSPPTTSRDTCRAMRATATSGQGSSSGRRGRPGTVISCTGRSSTRSAVLGYTLPVPHLAPRVYLEFDYASGDERPGGNVGTFNQLEGRSRRV